MRKQNLIAFRKERKMSTAEMAKMVGISESYYLKIEYGDRSPSYNFLIKFKAAFPDADTDKIFLTLNHT